MNSKFIYLIVGVIILIAITLYFLLRKNKDKRLSNNSKSILNEILKENPIYGELLNLNDYQQDLYDLFYLNKAERLRRINRSQTKDTFSIFKKRYSWSNEGVLNLILSLIDFDNIYTFGKSHVYITIKDGEWIYSNGTHIISAKYHKNRNIVFIYNSFKNGYKDQEKELIDIIKEFFSFLKPEWNIDLDNIEDIRFYYDEDTAYQHDCVSCGPYSLYNIEKEFFRELGIDHRILDKEDFCNKLHLVEFILDTAYFIYDKEVDSTSLVYDKVCESENIDSNAYLFFQTIVIPRTRDEITKATKKALDKCLLHQSTNQKEFYKAFMDYMIEVVYIYKKAIYEVHEKYKKKYNGDEDIENSLKEEQEKLLSYKGYIDKYEKFINKNLNPDSNLSAHDNLTEVVLST